MIDIKSITRTFEDEAQKALSALDRHFDTVRTGRATPNILDPVRVEAYGATVPLNQVATVNVTDARSLAVSPYDRNQLAAIERAIIGANLGFTPQNDGKVVRINIPPLTEERRKDLAKQAHKMAEDARVAIRQARKHANDAVKKIEKDKTISEDESRKAHDDIQGLTDKAIKKVDEKLAAKEKDIMHV